MYSKNSVFLMLLLYVTSSIQFNSPRSHTKYRLPCNIAPRVYRIELDPDFLGEKFVFTGNSTIVIEVLQSTNSIIVHKSHNISVKSEVTELIHKDGKVEKPLKQTWHSENEFYVMEFENKLDAGYYTLKMAWKGTDSSEHLLYRYKGFFRIENIDKNGNLSYLVSTNFEPTGARNTFPCWDEPGLKANFQISIKHFSNYTALSNMPVEYENELPDGKVVTHFMETPKMSPYLLCIVITDYQAIKNNYGNITFYGMEEKLASFQYALEISEKALHIMEAYTNIPYAMPKLDQIAISKYSSIAMEHWGLVSYESESVTLENTTLIPNIPRIDEIALNVAHELTHQWFGNLVTPVWWDDIWLNEAFAYYFQYKIVDKMFPHWRIMDYFVVEFVNKVSYKSEAWLEVPKPIKFYPRTTLECESIFNYVTYTKGSAVVHMLDHIFTKDLFQEGIQNYLARNQFKSIVANDLWSALQEVYDKKVGENEFNVRSTMDPWIEQIGYPILEVTRDNVTGDIVIKQTPGGYADSDSRWRIPINYATKSNPDFSSTAPMIWMKEDEGQLIIPNIPVDDWIIVNIQQRGFYEVKYDMDNWQHLIDYLQTNDFTKIHPVNRAQLIRDVFRMYKDSNVLLDLLIKITVYLSEESDYLVWIPAGEILEEFDRQLRNTPEENLFGLYSLFITKKITKRLGFEHREGDEHSAIKIRSILAPLVCRYGHAECNTFAQRMFETYLQNTSENAFPLTEWRWILCVGLRAANESAFDHFMNSNLPMLEYRQVRKHVFIYCADTDELRDKYVGNMLQNNVTADSNDITEMFEDLLNSNFNYATDYIIKHFDTIEKYYDQNKGSNIWHLLHLITVSIKTKEQYNKLNPIIRSKMEYLKEKLPLPNMDKIFAKKSKLELMQKQQSDFRKSIKKYFGIEVIDARKNLGRNKKNNQIFTLLCLFFYKWQLLHN